MREIKFRAWHIVKKEFVNLHQYVSLGNHGFMMSDCELMQYTGLLDKNGVEIYENDILRISYDDGDESYLTKVGSPLNAFSVDVRECDFDFTSLCWIYDVMPNSSIEVVGNIYKNGDLL